MADATDLKSVTYKVYRFDPGLEDSFSIQSSVDSLQSSAGNGKKSSVGSLQSSAGNGKKSSVGSLQSSAGNALFHKSYKSYKSYKIPDCRTRVGCENSLQSSASSLQPGMPFFISLISPISPIKFRIAARKWGALHPQKMEA